MTSTPAVLLCAENVPKPSWREAMSTMRLGEILGSVDNGWHPFGTRIKLCPD